MKIVILGLSITSSWGNGHATTYRSLIKGLHRRGHDVLFLERDLPWYASNRDMPETPYCRVAIYRSVDELKKKYHDEIENAGCVIVGSYVADGIEAAGWIVATASGVKAFYDIDTPVTLAALRENNCKYLAASLIPSFDLYLSFSAGPCLDIFMSSFGSPAAKQFYCSVDPELYFPLEIEKKWDLGYLGTYSDDRQPALNKLLVEPALKWTDGKFVVAGPQYPASISWNNNIERIEHLPPDLHVSFYNSQRYTLNITRRDMVKMGYSPSVRLFEAAACGVPVISDWWEGLDTIFSPGEEIFISESPADTLRVLRSVSENKRIETGQRAREVILRDHTGEKRAGELEDYIAEVNATKRAAEKVNAV
ncbi:MAG TPA: glycosyltransferase [Bacteroidales bacterium]|nr:glycosyltransferase [Bacteroidales bacterium]